MAKEQDKFGKLGFKGSVVEHRNKQETAEEEVVQPSLWSWLPFEVNPKIAKLAGLVILAIASIVISNFITKQATGPEGIMTPEEISQIKQFAPPSTRIK